MDTKVSLESGDIGVCAGNDRGAPVRTRFGETGRCASLLGSTVLAAALSLT
jgi:hypothetical protein